MGSANDSRSANFSITPGNSEASNSKIHFIPPSSQFLKKNPASKFFHLAPATTPSKTLPHQRVCQLCHNSSYAFFPTDLP